MVLKGANILSHMGDYPPTLRPELRERKKSKKVGETLIDTGCASEAEETAHCAAAEKQPKNPKITMRTKWERYRSHFVYIIMAIYQESNL